MVNMKHKATVLIEDAGLLGCRIIIIILTAGIELSPKG